MTKNFVFLLNLLFMSGWHQLQALLLRPLISNNEVFDDVGWSSFDNYPTDLGNPQEQFGKYPIEISADELAKAENDARRFLANFDQVKKLYANFPDNRLNPNTRNDISHVPTKRQDEEVHQDWHVEPLEFSCSKASMKKLITDDNKRLKRISGNPVEPTRFVDYTNSQMPFNEGRLHHKGLNEKSEDVMLKKNTVRSVRRRHLVAPHMRSYFDVPLDDPLMELSRVRRFLDSKRAKKQLQMSPTLVAKEAEMSGILDPNLNSEAILEPHVRKRRGLFGRKRDLSFYPKCKKKLKH